MQAAFSRAQFGAWDFSPTLNINALVVSGRTEVLRSESYSCGSLTLRSKLRMLQRGWQVAKQFEYF